MLGIGGTVSAETLKEAMPTVAGSKGTEMKFFPGANTFCLRTTVLR